MEISYLADWTVVWGGLVKPLCRLLFFIAFGLLIGNLIEALNWTRGVARLATPLVRLGHLRDISGAAFSMAFFSTVTANSMLSESYSKGELSKRELVFSNIFNSTPSFFLHLPSMFFMAVPFIGVAAVWYVSIISCAAILRTAGTVLAGRLLLPPLPEGCVECRLEDEASKGWRDALGKSLKRLRRRLPRIAYITIPVYITIFILQRSGGFDVLRAGMAEHASWLSFLHPEALSVLILHLAAEFAAALSAAGPLLDSGLLSVRDVVVTMVVGNVLSSPMRAFRHQFPSYSGIFTPRLAVLLIAVNQLLRASSIILVGSCYYIFTM